MLISRTWRERTVQRDTGAVTIFDQQKNSLAVVSLIHEFDKIATAK
jgi:hypothetical protein